MALETKKLKNKKGKEVERVVLGELSDEAKEFIENTPCMTFVDQANGLVMATRMVKKVVSPEDMAKREKDEAAAKAARIAETKAIAARKEKELADYKAKYGL